MRIGIGLPNILPGADGHLMLQWARRAEARGFAFVSTVGRLVYPSYDGLTTLAAAAAATREIELLTNVVLGPTYPDAMLAKIAMTVAELSGGRLTLGLGVGARESDYRASDRDFAARGSAFDAQLKFLHHAFNGEPVVGGDADGERLAVGPAAGEIPVLIAGHGRRAIRRTVRWGTGWTAATGGPQRAAPMVGRIRDAWHEAHREGEPRLVGLAYFSTDSKRTSESDALLRSFYAFAGERADIIATAAVRTPDRTRAIIGEFADAGMTDLVFTPTLANIDEVDRLADIVL